MTERVTDAILLQRFAQGREESAFAEVVRRHGPLVQRVCRGLLRDERDVEDVYQATFLLLATRAGDVAWQASAGGWLRDAARRLAMRARSEAARRRSRETPASSFGETLNFEEAGASLSPNGAAVGSVFADELERKEASQALDEAVGELPSKYRDPVVLCYFEGKTNQEAALELGYPVGSMSRRLERARGLLRKRLVSCGVSLALAFCLVSLISHLATRPNNRNGLDLQPIQTAMTLFEPALDGHRDLGELIDALERGGGDSIAHERVDHAAELAVLIADRIESKGPAGREATWRGGVGQMRLAALELSRASRRGDRAELLASARRLNTTCVQCHSTYQ